MESCGGGKIPLVVGGGKEGEGEGDDGCLSAVEQWSLMVVAWISEEGGRERRHRRPGKKGRRLGLFGCMSVSARKGGHFVEGHIRRAASSAFKR